MAKNIVSFGRVRNPVATTTPPSQAAELFEMLSYRRPHGSKSEARFINRFLLSITGARMDSFGNVILSIPEPDGQPSTVMWCAHTDSVHRTPGRQTVVYGTDGLARVGDGQPDSNCLGADNAAGCYLLRSMALAGRPGLYVWHRQEESGCQGSHHIASKTPQLLTGIRAAIAFDRRGTRSIITHQMNGRTASDDFAKSLAAIIGLDHEPDSNGILTDTNTYSGLIPECTNVSSGTAHEHCSDESLDVGYLLRLERALLAADFSGLAIKRDPSVYDFDESDAWWRDYYGIGGRYGARQYGGAGFKRGGYKSLGWASKRESSHHESSKARRDNLVNIIATYPDAVADLLEEYGVDYADIADYLGISDEWHS
jgi:hypothetical protein